MKRLLSEVRACTVCADSLEHGPRPVLAAHPKARVLIIGQAPGAKVHASGVAWADKSGERLRSWMGVDDETFYDERRIALMPMGFCYPGKGASGDLPPRPECAPLWHPKLLAKMPDVKLTLLIGMYAQGEYLGDKAKKTLTESVRAWKDYGAKTMPLPHPSPRNGIWLRRNEWFEDELVPVLRRRVKRALA